jgi:glucose/arabinose dehydrogenase
MCSLNSTKESKTGMTIFQVVRNSVIAAFVVSVFGGAANAQAPTITLPDLTVRTVVSGLSMPTGMAFIGQNEFLVLEKNTGMVKRVQNGAVQGVVLDLAVNFASERGLLGIAVHPDYPQNRSVYLFWTCVGTSTPPTIPPPPAPAPNYVPPEMRCSDSNMFGADSNNILRVPVLGNRIDRFELTPTNNLVYRENIIALRSFQNDGAAPPEGQGDEAQPPRGNHNGGVIRFGQDRKLYVFFGDQGRRGQLQNLANGPTPPLADDQFGGAEPDDDHLSGVILRLNPDGSAPADNPFFTAGATTGGAAGMNLQKVWAYGLRNSFGMTIEPLTGMPWISEHGDDSFDEINKVPAGMNGGWVQFAGPIQRITQFKQIETTFAPPDAIPSLQQLRWPPSRIANSQDDAARQLVMFPGARYVDPEFSWKWAALPVGLVFVAGNRLGADLSGDLLVNLVGSQSGPGYLLRFHVSGDSNLQFENAALFDRVADNSAKFDITESESLIVGTNYGTVTDMQMSPRGTVYAVSHSKGEIYEILSQNDADETDGNNGQGGTLLTASLSGSQEIPGPGDPDGSGTARIIVNSGQRRVCFELSVSNIDPASAAHIHSGALGEAGPVVVPLTAPTSGQSQGCADVDRQLANAIRANPGLFYVNVHNTQYPNGAVRGQLSKP